MSRRIRFFILLAGTCIPAFPALAQTSDPAGEVADQDIVVTALKRTEPLAKVAAPVSVVPGDRISRGAITTPDRLAEFSTSLTVLPNPTANIIFLRGVGNFTLNPSSDPAVGWNYDGVFAARANGNQGQFYDLDRVEVLKGPQGVLHGRNASAGTINLIPVQPQFGETSARITASYASRDTINGEAAINLALGERGALRISSQVLSQDSYLTGFAGSRQQAARIQFKSAVTDRVTIRFSGDVMRQTGVGQGTTYLGYYAFDSASGSYRLVPSNLDLEVGNRDPRAQAFRQTVPLTALGRNLDAQAAVPYQDNEIYGAHVEVVADLGFATLTVLPAWRYGDFDQNPPGAPFGYNYVERSDQRSVEARLAGTTGKLDWIVGGNLFDESVRSLYTQNFSTQQSISDSRYGTDSKALYGNLKFEIVPGVRLVGGVRQSWDRKSLEAITTTYTLACTVRIAGRNSCPTVPLLQLGSSPAVAGLPVPAAGPPVPVLVNGVPTGATIARADRIDSARSASFQVATWRAGLEADLGSRGVVYANVQRGYRPGGLNTATGFETYEPEFVTAYTLGGRWRSRGDVFSIAAEAFWWDYRNQQVSSVQPDLSTPARNVNFTRNIGSSRIRGFDIETRFTPTPMTTLYVNAQYLDSRYTDFTYLQVSNNVPPLTGCAATLITAPSLYRVDCSGQRPFASPEWTVMAGARHAVMIGQSKLDMMARARYVSEQNVGAAFLASQIVPSHWTFDAQAVLSLPGDRVDLGVFVYNISGERYPTFAIFHPTSNLVISTVSPPRIIGGRVTLRF